MEEVDCLTRADLASRQVGRAKSGMVTSGLVGEGAWSADVPGVEVVVDATGVVVGTIYVVPGA